MLFTPKIERLRLLYLIISNTIKMGFDFCMGGYGLFRKNGGDLLRRNELCGASRGSRKISVIWQQIARCGQESMIAKLLIARFMTLLCKQLLSSITKCVMIHIKELRCLAFVSTGYTEGFFKIEFLQGFLYGSKIYSWVCKRWEKDFVFVLTRGVGFSWFNYK